MPKSFSPRPKSAWQLATTRAPEPRETELRIRARAEHPYFPAVLLALTQVVHQLGLELHLPSDAESLPVIQGSRIAVDIRAGTDFQPAQCRPFYERLLTTRAPPYTGALVIVNAGPEDPVFLGLRALEPRFGERLAVVDWRDGDKPEPLNVALSRLVVAEPAPAVPTAATSAADVGAHAEQPSSMTPEVGRTPDPGEAVRIAAEELNVVAPELASAIQELAQGCPSGKCCRGWQ